MAPTALQARPGWTASMRRATSTRRWNTSLDRSPQPPSAATTLPRLASTWPAWQRSAPVCPPPCLGRGSAGDGCLVDVLPRSFTAFLTPFFSPFSPFPPVHTRAARSVHADIACHCGGHALPFPERVLGGAVGPSAQWRVLHRTLRPPPARVCVCALCPFPRSAFVAAVVGLHPCVCPAHASSSPNDCLERRCFSTQRPSRWHRWQRA